MAGTAVLKVFLLLLGFVLLVKGADFFVDGASGIAKKFKVSTFIIGVTVVALGTSAPEMAVTVISAVKGESGIIVGNITGSNIINILLILVCQLFQVIIGMVYLVVLKKRLEKIKKDYKQCEFLQIIWLGF